MQESISSRPTALYVNLNNLFYNLQQIKNYVGSTKVMAVVKSNAYGHGLVPVAQTFLLAGADYLGVALLEEGIELRKAGITAPILVFGGILGDQIKDYLQYDLDCTASSIDKLKAINEKAKELNKIALVHLKIDTGMGRIGVQYKNCQKFFNQVKNCSYCKIEGVFSHLATADDLESDFFEVQINRFKECISIFKQIYPDLNPIFHLANSASVVRSKESHFDMIRPGLLCYGYDLLNRGINLKTAFTLKSKIVYFKVLRKGDSVSYQRAWVAPKLSRIVTVPIGYGDGYFRALSNKARVLIRGKKYPIVGKICMDQIMVNIDMDEAYNQEEVVIIGQQENQRVTVQEIANLLDTVPHEVLTAINQRVPRIYLK